jgi:poly-gamma-glutamate synthesis protein (capsule biosynthesis protein)
MIATLCALALPPALPLIAVGDIMLDRYVGRAIEKYGVSYPLSKVRSALKSAVVTVGNLECPLTSRQRAASKRFVFRAPPSSVGALAGIDVLSVANNHSMDCGPEGLTDTIATLSAAGIQPVSRSPVVVERMGMRIGFVAFSDFPESGGDFSFGPGLLKEVAGMRSRTDFLVVMAHWGVEGSNAVSDRQRREAKQLADAGADLVLGSHPHVMQPVERIGRTVVAYSMGNFVFDAVTRKEQETAIYCFAIGRDGVQSWRLIPCRIEHARPVLLP